MKKISAIMFLSIISLYSVNAQSWQWLKTSGSLNRDQARQSVRDKNDNVYVSGVIFGSGNYNIGSSVYNQIDIYLYIWILCKILFIQNLMKLRRRRI